MEENGKNLMEYVKEQSKYWTWPPNEYHEVVFLGYDRVQFRFNAKTEVPTIRYYFRFVNGQQKPIDVRSLVFARKMSQYQSGDCLRIRRNEIGDNRYEYEVSKIA